jgi:hypothetical protein
MTHVLHGKRIDLEDQIREHLHINSYSRRKHVMDGMANAIIQPFRSSDTFRFKLQPCSYSECTIKRSVY